MEHVGDRDVLGGGHLLLRDVAVAVHFADDRVAPGLGLLGVLDRVPARRRLRDSREHCGLGDVQVLRGLGEEVLGGSLDAVAVGAELGQVEVPGEDLVFRHLPFDGDREPRLVDLSGDRALGGLLNEVVVVVHAPLFDEGVLDVLLRDGRAAGGVASREVVDERSRQALDVDAVVLVKAPVLDRDGGVLHVLGDLVRRDDDPVFGVEGRDLAPVGGQKHRLLRGLDESEVVGAFLEHGGHRIGSGAGGRSYRHDEACEKGPADEAHAQDGSDECEDLTHGCAVSARIRHSARIRGEPWDVLPAKQIRP